MITKEYILGYVNNIMCYDFFIYWKELVRLNPEIIKYIDII